MANCTASEVKLIISTKMSDTNIGTLIALADTEITERGLDILATSIKKTLSMYLTADLIINGQPPSIAAGPTGATAHPNDMWRRKAESLILKTAGLPIITQNDPLPNE